MMIYGPDSHLFLSIDPNTLLLLLALITLMVDPSEFLW